MGPSIEHRSPTYAPRHHSLEGRRTRGEIACAECRRLKLKCNRTIPCSSCIKRDCAELCPNASVVTKDTTRAVIAASQPMHDDIARLRRRARALESALGELYHQRTGAVHPLIDQDDDFGDDSDDCAVVDGVVDGLATLHLSNDDGMERFFGNVQLPEGSSTAVTSGELVELPPVLERCIRFFPFPTSCGTHEQAVAALRRFLPDRTYAKRLLHSVFEDSMFIFPAVEKDVVFDEVLPDLYDPRLARPPSAITHQERGDSPRAFALLFALLAQGALLDTDDPDRESRATTFSRLSLAGLGAVSVFEKPSYMSVLALHMHSAYHVLLQKELGDTGRCFSNLAFQTATHMGLDFDPSHWGLPWVTTQRRRRLFWAIFQVKIWECVSTGRPPVISDPALVDCKFPCDEGTEHDVDGPKLSADTALVRITRDMVARVVVLTGVIAPPQYQEILAVDTAIRTGWGSPAQMTLLVADAKLSAIKHAIVTGPVRSQILMCLHRGHFVQAVNGSPLDPTRSPYSVSFRASVHCAWEILEWMPTFFEIDPRKVVYAHPLSFTWTLMAAMVVYTIVEKAPHSDCVHAILAQLEKARDVFAAAKELGGGRATSALPTLQGLCVSSRHIIADRDARSDRVAWDIEPGQAWSPLNTLQRQTTESAKDTTSPTWSQFNWLDDDVSDSFKSLFRSHYRDAQQYIVPSVPSSRSSSSPPSRPIVSSSYPGYLQRPPRSTVSSQTSSKAPKPLIRLPALHPDLLRTSTKYERILAPPAADVQSPTSASSLTGIWLSHSRQLGTTFVTHSGSSSEGSQRSPFDLQHPDHSEWY